MCTLMQQFGCKVQDLVPCVSAKLVQHTHTHTNKPPAYDNAASVSSLVIVSLFYSVYCLEGIQRAESEDCHS